ncbi:GTPase Era [Campylobacter avium]|uniref:GTPase Era n=1 Tax=Campylobacter avium TaxID=522485 RepID=UPI0023539CC6|nr:GTPase Era [Campylobacter avium]
MKSGFVSVIGRTNAGKSTLVNSLLGEKIALVSHKRNATRRKINAIVMHDDKQIIFIDTPGLHKSDKLFNQSLIESAKKSIKDCDIVLFVVSVKDSTKDYEDFLAFHKDVKHVLVINKVDLEDKKYLLNKIQEYAKFDKYFQALIPFSCKKKAYKNILLDELCKHLNYDHYFYDTDILSSSSQRDIYREFILEALFESFADELPYSSDVIINEVKNKNDILCISANLITDTQAHKKILIGKNAEALKRIGIKARKKIEKFASCKVNLELFVLVKKAWTKDKQFLEKILR